MHSGTLLRNCSGKLSRHTSRKSTRGFFSEVPPGIPIEIAVDIYRPKIPWYLSVRLQGFSKDSLSSFLYKKFFRVYYLAILRNFQEKYFMNTVFHDFFKNKYVLRNIYSDSLKISPRIWSREFRNLSRDLCMSTLIFQKFPKNIKRNPRRTFWRNMRTSFKMHLSKNFLRNSRWIPKKKSCNNSSKNLWRKLWRNCMQCMDRDAFPSETILDSPLRIPSAVFPSVP